MRAQRLDQKKRGKPRHGSAATLNHCLVITSTSTSGRRVVTNNTSGITNTCTAGHTNGSCITAATETPSGNRHDHQRHWPGEAPNEIRRFEPRSRGSKR
ncbi:unnamed protein product [Lampetra planeri]